MDRMIKLGLVSFALTSASMLYVQDSAKAQVPTASAPAYFTATARGAAVSRAQALAAQWLKAPELTRRNTRIHFVQPLKERLIRETGYGLLLEGESADALVKASKAATK